MLANFYVLLILKQIGKVYVFVINLYISRSKYVYLRKIHKNCNVFLNPLLCVLPRLVASEVTNLQLAINVSLAFITIAQTLATQMCTYIANQ